MQPEASIATVFWTKNSTALAPPSEIENRHKLKKIVVHVCLKGIPFIAKLDGLVQRSQAVVVFRCNVCSSIQ